MKKLLIFSTILISMVTCVLAVSITFTWSKNTDPSAKGYRVYSGISTNNYTNSVDAGTNTNITLSNLLNGTTYYFSAKVYGTYVGLPLESEFSPEIVFTTPLPITNTLPSAVQDFKILDIR